MAGRFIPAPNIDALIQEDAKPLLREKAVEIAARAVGHAPERTGRYRRSIRVSSDGRGVAVEAMDPMAHVVESGSVNNPPYAPLRRAAKDVADRFEPT